MWQREVSTASRRSSTGTNSDLSSLPGKLPSDAGETRGERWSPPPGTAALAAEGIMDAGVGEQEHSGLTVAAGRTGFRSTSFWVNE